MSEYNIILKPEAVKDMDALKKYDAVIIADQMEKHLKYNPDLISKSKIRKLRSIQKTDYRLRIGDYKVFYSIDKLNYAVNVLRIMHKEQTSEFYKEDK